MPEQWWWKFSAGFEQQNNDYVKEREEERERDVGPKGHSHAATASFISFIKTGGGRWMEEKAESVKKFKLQSCENLNLYWGWKGKLHLHHTAIGGNVVISNLLQDCEKKFNLFFPLLALKIVIMM